MTDQIISTEQQPEDQQPQEPRSSAKKIGILFTTLAMTVFVCGFGYGYYQLSQINMNLAQSVAELQRKVDANQAQLDQAQQTMVGLQQSSQKSQELSNQQEQLMSEWRAAQQGDLNQWRIAEAQYLVRLANDHLAFTHNTQLALTLLQRADQVLVNQSATNALQIRKSLATDIASLQAVPQVDVTATYLRLSGLNNQVDKLPLPSTPMGDAEPSSPPVATANLPWWKAGMQKTLEALRKIVIVRYNTSNSLPLALPDEKIFLFQNIHAQFENAMWAVLNQNAAVYQASLARAQDWIKEYFVQDAAATKSMLDGISELQKLNLEAASVDLNNTLQLFDAALAVKAPATAKDAEKTNPAPQAQ